jgi:hypothetical protein
MRTQAVVTDPLLHAATRELRSYASSRGLPTNTLGAGIRAAKRELDQERSLTVAILEGSKAMWRAAESITTTAPMRA